MPQPFSRIVPNARIVLRRDILNDKPEMARLVAEIFAIWSDIEADLSMLLAKILGTTESPALAIYSVLTAQHLQSKALEAAAGAALPPDHYEIFLAVTSVIQSAQAPRNQIAHWLWGACEQRPDLLALADPKMVRGRGLQITQYMAANFEKADFVRAFAAELESTLKFDPNHVVGYSVADLTRARDELSDASEILMEFEFYLRPQYLYAFLLKAEPPEKTRATMLALLNDKRLFREALARIRSDRQSIPEPTTKLPPPTEGGSA